MNKKPIKIVEKEIKLKFCKCCKCDLILTKYYEKNRKGEYYKSCNGCRKSNREKARLRRCIHNRQKSNCKECKGSQICTHNRHKSSCKECKGSSICIHNRVKSVCKECCGGSICIHNKQKRHCKDCDPVGYLRSIVSNRVYSALKSSKSKHILEYLGCNIKEFKEHITKSFTEGMTWGNYGEWEIDHIVPIKYDSPTLEDVIERLHWTNTQALWKADNISKGNRWIG